jgi:hypothetical protein
MGWVRAVENAAVWTLPIAATTPTGAADHFFHLKNTSSDVTLAVVDVNLVRASTTEDIEILQATGTASSPTAITPVNWQIGASKAPSVTAERGADLVMTVVAADIIATHEITTTRSSFPNVNYDTPLILSPGVGFVLNAVTGTVEIGPGSVTIIAL